jgi:ABC-type polysaccharide/polyol phosphate transport system ATPase subunit
VLRFDGVSKRYRLRLGWGFGSLRDEVASLTRRLLGREEPSRRHFWALREVSFEIRRGETVGIIGANGAGKSTALKILSRVTVPTTGSVRVWGRLGALIEVGAGFHPDLTGRENVYLNGAIMGMRRAELDAKYESIVAFSELGRFIETPIKYYSSGMQVRLGFAVAAHIDPDILLVDEVLAVGDAAFQAKCLNKLAELRERARTIVLVSHNMSNIVQHCDRVIWLERGQVRAEGDPQALVEAYLAAAQPKPQPLTQGPGEGSPIRISRVAVRGPRVETPHVLEHDAPATVEVTYEVTGPVDNPALSVAFEDGMGRLVAGLTTRLDDVKLDTSRPEGTVELVLAPAIFTRGAYRVTVAILDERLQRYLDLSPRAAFFTVEGPSIAGREVAGAVVLPHRWQLHG